MFDDETVVPEGTEGEEVTKEEETEEVAPEVDATEEGEAAA